MNVTLPPMLPVRQRLPEAALPDPPAAMRRAVAALVPPGGFRPGARVAVTAGSRGIAGISVLLREAVAALRAAGAEPFVLAAMGSHGGGTAEGRRAVLDGLGVTPPAVGAPVETGGEPVPVGRTADGQAVWLNRLALEADGILAINRVKPHTSFHGALESGLVKMLVVGLGGPAGAAQFHSLGPERLSAALAEAGGVLLRAAPVLGGVAVLEDGHKRTADLVPVPAADLLKVEPAWLERAKALLPRLPVDALDLLVVDEMGKEIAGTGMDTNVIGRMGIQGVADGRPEIRRIAVLDLTPASHGNANGMGLADFITERFRARIDFATTYLNCLTATFVQRARMPVVLPSDQAVVTTALRTLGCPPPDTVRIARIKNTLQLERFWVSAAVAAEWAGLPHVTVEGAPAPWRFDPAGNLIHP